MALPEQEINLKLIECVRDRELLWNTSHKDHKKIDRKNDAWIEIGGTLHISPEAARKKWYSLTAAYRRERNKVLASNKSGSGPESAYRVTWYAFNAMQFIGDKLSVHSTLCSIEVIVMFISLFTILRLSAKTASDILVIFDFNSSKRREKIAFD